MKSLAQSHDEFIARLRYLESRDPLTGPIGPEEIILAVGLLIGGGFPDSASYIAYAATRAFPDATWPWDTNHD